ncbi:hypothetical protein HOLleu_12677 [Holothuria leucospilota]|uniref:Uncharacterized protein n=1 Tax=Holothuria leucospilota TaxID=206669 RepID=A0A9Q1HAA6_HOLLE|nr:hypothetical protein HOLleu_12677 [Holothuria leucospilota]
MINIKGNTHNYRTERQINQLREPIRDSRPSSDRLTTSQMSLFTLNTERDIDHTAQKL